MPVRGVLKRFRFELDVDVFALVSLLFSGSSAVSCIVLVGVLGLGGELVREVRDDREDRVKTFVSEILVVVRLGFGISWA